LKVTVIITITQLLFNYWHM